MAEVAAPALKCEQCGLSEGQLLRCSRCKNAWYCNAECQKSAWAVHKKLCKKAQEHARNHSIQQECDWKDGTVSDVAIQKAQDLVRLGEVVLAVVRLRKQRLKDPEASARIIESEEEILLNAGVQFLDPRIGVDEDIEGLNPQCRLCVAEPVAQSEPLIIEGIRHDWLQCQEEAHADFLQAALAFVQRAVEHNGGVEAAVEATNFSWPAQLDVPELDSYDLSQLGCSWIAGWTHLGAEQLKEALLARGEDNHDGMLLLLLRYLTCSWPQVGLMRVGSKCDHSCTPTGKVERTQEAAQVISTRDLDPGELLTIDYLALCGVDSAGLHVTERRAQLKLRWAFVCQCNKCCEEAANEANV